MSLFDELKKPNGITLSKVQKEDRDLLMDLVGRGFVGKNTFDQFKFKVRIDRQPLDTQDSRDYLSDEVEVPLTTVDKPWSFIPWTNQHSRPYCVSFAVAKAFYYLDVVSRGMGVRQSQDQCVRVSTAGYQYLPVRYPSAQYLHSCVTDPEVGAVPRRVIANAIKSGVATESTWRTSVYGPAAQRPPTLATNTTTASGYVRVDTFDEALRMIDLGHPLIVTMDVTEGVSRILSGSDTTFEYVGNVIGRHCMMSNRSDNGALVLDNSWDTPYRYHMLTKKYYKQANTEVFAIV